MAVNWSRKQSSEVAELLSTDLASGLTRKNAAARLREEGKNTLFCSAPSSIFALIKKLFADVVHLPLLFSVIMGFSYVSVWFGLGTVLLWGVFIFLYVALYMRAERYVFYAESASLPRARVLREGQVLSVDVSRLVRGDVILLRAGDLVPCDLYVFEASGLEINEGSAYPEGGIVRKGAAPTDAEPFAYASMRNILFATSRVVSGSCRAVCTATGGQTMVAREGRSTAIFGDHQSRIRRELTDFSNRLTPIFAVFALLCLFIALLRGESLGFTAFFVGAATFASILPACMEGVSLIFYAAYVRHMTKKKRVRALLKNPLSADVLPTLQCLILDTDAFFDDSTLSVYDMNTDGGHAEIEADKQFLYAAAQTVEGCIPAKPAQSDIKEIIRTPASDAVLAYLKEVGAQDFVDIEIISYRPRDIGFSFDSVLMKDKEGAFLFSRGDAMDVLRGCSERRKDGNVLPMDADTRARLSLYIRTAQNDGRTVVAYAMKRMGGADGNSLESGTRALGRDLIFLGMAVLYKGECGSVDAFFNDCQRYHLEPLIFHRGSADSARRLLFGHRWLGQARICDGRSLPETPASFSQLLNHYEVFADFSKEQKKALGHYLIKNHISFSVLSNHREDIPLMKMANAAFVYGEADDFRVHLPDAKAEKTTLDPELTFESDAVLARQIDTVTDVVGQMHRYRNATVRAVRYLLLMTSLRAILLLFGFALGVLILPTLPFLYLTFVFDSFLLFFIWFGKKDAGFEPSIWRFRKKGLWIRLLLPSFVSAIMAMLSLSLLLIFVPQMPRAAISLTAFFACIACAVIEAFIHDGARCQGRLRMRIMLSLIAIPLLFGMPYISRLVGLTFSLWAYLPILPTALVYLISLYIIRHREILRKNKKTSYKGE